MAPNHLKVIEPSFEVTHFHFRASKLESARVGINRSSFFHFHSNWLAIVLAFDVANNHLRSLDSSASAVAVLLLGWKLHKLVAPIEELADISSIVFCKRKFTSGVGACKPLDIEDLVVKHNNFSLFIISFALDSINRPGLCTFVYGQLSFRVAVVQTVCELHNKNLATCSKYV